ncbi:MAG: leucyl aminopeptidase [Myxococcota bacterium]|jgi:leucyl aminopeptidase|nr:leucyl aminopeptidase [Myxococcota bacterium]
MKITWNKKPLAHPEAEVIAVAYSTDEGSAFAQVDKLSDGALRRAAKQEGFAARPKGAFVWQGEVGSWRGRIVALGGPFADAPVKAWRAAASRLIELAAKCHARSVDLWLDDEDFERVAGLVAQAAVLASYRFTKYKTKDVLPVSVAALRLGARDGCRRDAAIRRAIESAMIEADAVCQARDLVNEPASALGPLELCAYAKSAALSHGLGCKVLTREALEKKGMGLILGVSAASPRPPFLVHLRYKPKGKPTKRIALVGKGITFDTGGLCLKQARSMDEMKTDMAGAAAVICAMSSLGALGVKAEVHGIVPIADNAIGGAAMRPGDVLKAAGGLTVEVINTDAEGRLILADALTYATGLSADAIVDLATLTGSCTVALGESCAGLFGSDEKLCASILGAAETAGEALWRMPLLDDLEGELSSDVADLKNVGTRTYGGAIVAALFLRRFCGKIPWVHLDIAGPARASRATAACPKGGTGYGVLTLLEFLRSL